MDDDYQLEENHSMDKRIIRTTHLRENYQKNVPNKNK